MMMISARRRSVLPLLLVAALAAPLVPTSSAFLPVATTTPAPAASAGAAAARSSSSTTSLSMIFNKNKKKDQEDLSYIETRDMTRAEMEELNRQNEDIMNAELIGMTLFSLVISVPMLYLVWVGFFSETAGIDDLGDVM